IEMNTRLQVEHPVTEAVYGVDLVAEQLRIAAGEGLPLSQDQIAEHGHAFESRLYAENPDQNFTPSIGDLTTLRLPADRARVDAGVSEGQEISPFYDPMIAKIITHGDTRAEALGRMRAALSATRVAGVETNARFLNALASDADFAAGDVSTKYIEEHHDALFDRPHTDARVLAAAAVYARAQTLHADQTDPWRGLRGFRINTPREAVYWVNADGAPAILRLRADGDGFAAMLEPDASAAARRDAGKDYAAPAETSFRFTLHDSGNGDIRLTVDGKTVTAFAAPHGPAGSARIWIGAECWDVAFPDPLAASGGAQSAEGTLTAPMPGVITLLKVSEGDAIAAGDALIVMEAMKMEHTIKAPHDGVVKSFRFAPGDQVKDGDLLVEFEQSQ
ncbi:MAG: biotin/lipoyl-containing protein, partial [Pseudomonadota bacterium]